MSCRSCRKYPRDERSPDDLERKAVLLQCSAKKLQPCLFLLDKYLWSTCHVAGIVPRLGDSGPLSLRGSSSRGYRWAVRKEKSLEGWGHSGPGYQGRTSLRRWCSRWDLSADMRCHACGAQGRPGTGHRAEGSSLSLRNRRNVKDLGQGRQGQTELSHVTGRGMRTVSRMRWPRRSLRIPVGYLRCPLLQVKEKPLCESFLLPPPSPSHPLWFLVDVPTCVLLPVRF